MSEAPTIPMTAEDAYVYARDIIKDRWPEGEVTIATDPYYAYAYAHVVINERWPEAEAVIATHPLYAYAYACHVINGRWPEAEGVIAADSYWHDRYQEFLTSLGATR